MKQITSTLSYMSELGVLLCLAIACLSRRNVFVIVDCTFDLYCDLYHVSYVLVFIVERIGGEAGFSKASRPSKIR